MAEVETEQPPANPPAEPTTAIAPEQAQAQAVQQALAAQMQPPTPTSASLYVGDLNPEVTEAMLFEKFNAIGPVASIRVCRDAITRRSLGYAYVNFVNQDHARSAIQNNNFDPIAGRPCRIMWSQRDPSMRKSGLGNIFIKNLDKEIDNKTLYDTFQQFGDILSCKVVTDPEGNSRGFGFVHYETQAAADEAIKQVNGMLLNDVEVYVGKFQSKTERLEESGKIEKEFKNLYVKGFDESITDELLTTMFEKFGEISSLKIATKPSGTEGEVSRCFGFIAYKDPESARLAVEGMNETELENGKKLYVARAQKKRERVAALRSQYEKRRAENQSRYKGVNLYVKNLDDTITDDSLRVAFEKFGTITSAKVMRDDKQASKGFGFVCFSLAEEATKAVTEMNGHILEKKPLYVALAQRKDERRQQIALQHNQRRHQMLMQQGMYPGGNAMGMPPQGQMMYMPAMQQVSPRYPYGQPMPRGGQFPRQMPMVPYQQGARMPPQAQPGNRNQNRQPKRGQQQNQNFRQQPMAPRPTLVPAQQPVTQQQQQPPQQQQVPQPALHQPGQTPLTASALASATTAEQKQMLGERLFPLIQATHAELAGKITGMLLEMDNSELLHLLEDGNALNSKVTEAVSVLEEHQRSQT